jgi:ADP-heptose:LPS heptosyltransferase
VAARFYFNDCFPDSPANREFVLSILDGLGSHLPVVLLGTPFNVDDHCDWDARGTRVITMAGHMTPARNLAVQTAVIARARAFVGTYGGYSYLAPLCGVPSLAFYSTPDFKVHHLHVAQHICARLGGPTVVPIDVAAAPLAGLALAGAALSAGADGGRRPV